MSIISIADHGLNELFFDILKNKKISTVFQPILSLRDGTVYAYEALSRGPENTALHNPVDLFEKAEELYKTWELELLCRTVAIETIRSRSMMLVRAIPD